MGEISKTFWLVQHGQNDTWAKNLLKNGFITFSIFLIKLVLIHRYILKNSKAILFKEK